ncbi:TIP49 C-terminus-domain-containing protein [Amylocystis lapponica]|nr:TIP49 C-terminus-domain-containing protein [Amylocystis lapponica]
MASNRGMARIRGTKFRSPHGLPVDLLDRVLIVNTQPYNENEVIQIIKIRCEEEDVTLADNAAVVPASMAMETTLRSLTLALHLLSSLLLRSRRLAPLQVSTPFPLNSPETSDDTKLGRDNGSWTKSKEHTTKKPTSSGPTAASSSYHDSAEGTDPAQPGQNTSSRDAAEPSNSGRLFLSK